MLQTSIAFEVINLFCFLVKLYVDIVQLKLFKNTVRGTNDLSFNMVRKRLQENMKINTRKPMKAPFYGVRLNYHI